MSKSLLSGIKALSFLSTKKSAGVTEIANYLGVNKSTAYRIMETLKEINFVEKDPQISKYRIGPAILKLSENYYQNKTVLYTARSIMIDLTEKTGESVHLAVLSNNSAVIIEQIMANSRIVVNARIGDNEPLNASSIGKCILAFQPDEEIEKTINNLVFKKYTENTIMSKEKLREELYKIREDGYSMDMEELSMGVRCVAVPIFDNHASCTYSLGISGTSLNMSSEHLQRVIEEMKKAGTAISLKLGYFKR